MCFLFPFKASNKKNMRFIESLVGWHKYKLSLELFLSHLNHQNETHERRYYM